MANKKLLSGGIFRARDPYDLLSVIIASAGNAIAGPALSRLSNEAAKLLGVGGASLEEQISLNLSRLQLQRQESETAKTKALSEMEIQMYRYRLEEKEIAIAERRRRLENATVEKAQLNLPEAQMVVDGALTIPQDRGGIVFPEEPPGYQDWIGSLRSGKVILVLGKRGSGKTALAARVAEFISATYGLAIYWLGLPEAAASLLPRWVKIINDPGQVPNGSVVLADEAGLRYASLAFQSKGNKDLRSRLMIARHNYTTLIFAVQSSRDLEASIVRQSDTVIFKQPGFNQPESERLDIRPMARKAKEIFEQISPEKRAASAAVFDSCFTGVITTTLPSFWSNGLSHAYRYMDAGQLDSKRERADELERVVKGESNLLEADSLDARILELRAKGYGLEKISKLLHISQYRVRKCLGM